MPAQITALPTPPSTNDPANFNTRADAFLGQMPTFATEANAVATEVAASAAQVAADRAQTGSDRTAAAASAASALAAPGTNGSSTTSLSIGTGTKSFTTQSGKSWIAGQGFFLASSASPTNWMTGVLIAYNSGTGVATVEVDTLGGSGTFTAWNCGLSAGRPMPVASQIQAETGTDATTWMTPQRTAQAALAFGVPVGAVIQAAGGLGARWLPCTGLIYQKSSYPALGALLPSYVRPMVLRSSAVIATGNRLCYGGGIFVGWGYSAPYTSTDGVTWTPRSYAWTPPTRVIYGGGIFVAYYSTLITTSPDGAIWTSRTNPFSGQDIRGVAYGPGGWVIFGYDASTGVASYGRSVDGISWQKSGDWSVNHPIAAYDAGNSRWIVLGGDTQGWRSTDNGQTWSSYSIPPISGVSGIVSLIYGNGRFVMHTANGYLLTSANGMINYEVVASPPFGTQHTGVYFDGTNFFVTNSTGQIARSADLVSWTVLDTGLTDGAISGLVRASGALTTPTVIGVANLGVYSGLDTSPTEFRAPTVVPANLNLSAFIKAT